MRRPKTRPAPTNHRPSFPQPISPSFSQSLRGCNRPPSIVLRIHWPSAARSDGRQWSAPPERRKLPRLQAPAKSPAPCVLCEIAAGQGSAGPAIGGRLRRRCVLRGVIGRLSPDCGAGVEQVSLFGRGKCVRPAGHIFGLEMRDCFRGRTGRRWHLERPRSARKDGDFAPAVRTNLRHATCLLDVASSNV